MIELESLSKIYHSDKGAPVNAVQDLDLCVPTGQICGLIGPSGAGKTTVLEIVAGLEPLTAGRIRLNGYDLDGEREMAMRQLGAVIDGGRGLQETLPVWENMARCERARSTQAQRERVLRELDLWPHRGDTVGQLSQGTKRLVAVACALIAEPPILLLDEPTQYLDTLAARRVKAQIRQLAHEKGTAVLLTTRRPRVAQALCDRVVVIRQGRAVADRPISELDDLIRGEHYQIRIKGELDSSRSEWLGGLSLAAESAEQAGTILSCVVADQAALHGLLAKIRDLGIPLLSATRVEPGLNAVLAHLMFMPLNELEIKSN